MNGVSGKQLIRAAVAIGILAALALGTVAYHRGQTRSADVVLASAAVEGLASVGEGAATSGGATMYSIALEDNWAAIDLFLYSESANSLPEIAEPVEQAWTAFLVADELWRLAEEGQLQPRIAEVYRGQQIVGSVPAVAGMLVGEGAEARFDNADMQVVRALFAFAGQQRMVAAVRVSNELTELE